MPPGSGRQCSISTFSHDLWYAYREPDYVPSLPVPETGTVVGRARFVDPGAGDYHLGDDSPALGAGIAVPESAANMEGACPIDPPNIGAY